MKYFVVSLIVLVTLNETIFDGQITLGWFILFTGLWFGLDLIVLAVKEWKAGRFRLFGKRNYSGRILPKDWYK